MKKSHLENECRVENEVVVGWDRSKSSVEQRLKEAKSFS